MNFKSFLQNSARKIDKELEAIFHNWSKDVDQVSPRLYPYANALAETCGGGKRIRGALVMLGYEMACGGWHVAGGSEAGKAVIGSDREILKVAAGYEIFQAAILAHDDIVDKSELRRGKPSLYSRMGGDFAGISKAICLGDIGFFLAFKIISDSGFPDKVKNKALKIFSQAMLDTGLGELLDIDLATGQKLIEVSDIISVYTYKTAFYTITTPLQLGAVLRGASDDKLEPIKLYGQNLGIAFQIKDDINDIFKENKGLGKEPGGDIKEGKKTLLYLNANENIDEKQRKILNKYYGNPNIGQDEMDLVKDVLQKSGSLEYSQKEVEKYAKKAKKYIRHITSNEEYRNLLIEMAEYFV